MTQARAKKASGLLGCPVRTSTRRSPCITYSGAEPNHAFAPLLTTQQVGGADAGLVPAEACQVRGGQGRPALAVQPPGALEPPRARLQPAGAGAHIRVCQAGELLAGHVPCLFAVFDVCQLLCVLLLVTCCV